MMVKVCYEGFYVIEAESLDAALKTDRCDEDVEYDEWKNTAVSENIGFCDTCSWYGVSQGMCYNWKSPHCANFTDPYQRCREWESEEADHEVSEP